MQPVATVFIRLEELVIRANAHGHLAVLALGREVLARDGDLVELLGRLAGGRLVELQADCEI